MTDSSKPHNPAAPLVIVSAPDDDSLTPMDLDNQSTSRAFWNIPPGSAPFNSTHQTRIMFNSQTQFVESPKARTPEDSGVVMSPANVKNANNSNTNFLEQIRRLQLSTTSSVPGGPPRLDSITTMVPLRLDSISTPPLLPPAPHPKITIPPPSVSLKPPIISNEMLMSPVPSPLSENTRPRSADAPSAPPNLPVPHQQFRSSSHDSLLAVHSTEFICFAIYRFWHNASPPLMTQIQAFRQSPSSEVPPSVKYYPTFVTSVHRLLISSGLHAHNHLSTVFLALLYVARLRRAINTNEPKGPGSEYRVLVISLILAQKYLSDDRYSNTTWAKLSGLNVQDINTTEMEFLSKINWRLHVIGHEWDLWLRAVELVRADHRRWTAGLARGQSQDSSGRAHSVGGASGGRLTESLALFQMVDDKAMRTFTWPSQKR